MVAAGSARLLPVWAGELALVGQNIMLALEISDDVVLLNSGHIAHSGPVDMLRDSPYLLNRPLGAS